MVTFVIRIVYFWTSYGKSMRAWLVVFFLTSFLASPMLTVSPDYLSNVETSPHLSEATNISVTPNSGWTTGGESITITGSGFSNLAFNNITTDGLTHSWTVSTVDYVQGGHGDQAIAVTSNGDIHIVYYNYDTHQLKHAVYDGSSWSRSVIVSNSGSMDYRDVEMVVDGNDHLHVSHWVTGDYLHYRFFNGTDWSIPYTTSNADSYGTGIAVDSQNRAHIVFSSPAYVCGGLHLAYDDGSGWNKIGLDTSTDLIGCYPSIDIDDNDAVHVSYRDHRNSRFNYITNESGPWDKYQHSNTNMPGYYTQTKVKSDGDIFIIQKNSNGLRYAEGYPGSQWSQGGITGDSGDDTSLFLDALDRPHVLHWKSSTDDLLYSTRSASGSWSSMTIDGTGGLDVGRSNALVVDDNHQLHAAYADYDNKNLRYATMSTGLIETSEVSIQFGQYGNVTATVLDDSTIQVTTPIAGSTYETVDLTLWGDNGAMLDLNVSYLFIAPDDLDMDGVLNDVDDCSNVAGTSTIDLLGCPDQDGDGYSDTGDVFPSDASEWNDTDGDGVGDNGDAFPNDATETLDTDGDGVGNNADDFPLDPNEDTDTDGDGVGDNSDAFPLDPYESMDSDNDGVGDNSDMFPFNAFEYLDSDGDGAGDNSDMFPFDANETMDSDGDGVGDNADAFPLDASETKDSDNDGIGDNTDSHPFVNNFIDSDNDGIIDLSDEFPNDVTQWLDADGDGYGDNISGNYPDLFPTVPSQWSDIDGDGFGDNWGNASWDEERDAFGIGQFVAGAVLADYCPEVPGNSSMLGFYGCPDSDGDGIPNMFDIIQLPTDSDGDGIFDEFDQCPNTPLGTLFVDAFGCEIDTSSNGGDDGLSSEESGFFSGEVAQTVGIGAVLIAIFSLLQTNAVAAILPDAFRWVQVFRRNSELSREEENELTYLQSLVQTYYTEPETLREEVRNLKSDLTARFMNNEIKQETREKMFVVINELLEADASELQFIAQNDGYFGLGDVSSVEHRFDILEEEVAMRDTSAGLPPASASGEINPKDGYEWLEYPKGSGTWFVRDDGTKNWTLWEN